MRVAILIIVFAFVQTYCSESDSKVSAQVLYVNDGDTLTVRLTAKERNKTKIRLATIDAPEMSQDFGKNSKDALKDLVLNKTVKLDIIGKDRYGRLVAEVFLNETSINEEQIKRGLAWFYRRHSDEISWNTSFRYSEAESFARENKIGLWSKNDPKPPWEYRKDNRNNR